MVFLHAISKSGPRLMQGGFVVQALELPYSDNSETAHWELGAGNEEIEQ